MKTRLCEMFGIDVPIVAFSHCRDVIVAAAKAGGIGVFGAILYSPEELARELDWIEQHIDGRPYGVDVLFPSKFHDVGAEGEDSAEVLIPPQHKAFVDDLLARYDVAHLPDGGEEAMVADMIRRRRGTPAYAAELLDVAFRYPGVKLMVSAIGVPPSELVERAHAAGIKFGAMTGKPEHARRQKAAGVDLIIAQGYEAGGHTGDITTMVLVPQVVDAVAPLPVLAAGGIGRGRQVAAALCLGAEGAWCGSVWMTTSESEATPALRERLVEATSADTVRTRSFTGKPVRVLRSAWTDAWDAPEAPPALMRPLQQLLREPAMARTERAGADAFASCPIGQIVGEMNAPTSVRQVYHEMLVELGDAMERMSGVIE